MTGGRLGGERDDDRPADLGADVADEDDVDVPDAGAPASGPPGPSEPTVDSAPGEQEDG